MNDALEILARIEHGARRRRFERAADLDWLADGLACWRRRDCPSLDAAFGVEPDPGERQRQHRQALARRDELVREAAKLHYAGERRTHAAQKFATALARYRSTAWRTDRANGACPSRYDGTLTAVLFEVLSLVDADIGERRVRQVWEMADLSFPKIRGKT